MKNNILTVLFICFTFWLSAQEVYITGYVDASCPQAKGRTVEIYVSGTVNLSAWNLVRQSNGNGYTANISISDLGTLTDEFAYITNDEEILLQEFEIGSAVVLQTGAINDNGDDAFQLVDQFGNIIDRFGEEGVQPDNNSPWFHQKTYYYRKNGESPNHGNFDPENWIFGDLNLLTDEGLCNDGQAYEDLVPFGTFDPILCEPITNLPYHEDFENNTPPLLHNCLTLTSSGEGNDWVSAEIHEHGFDSHVLKYEANEHTANTWVFLKAVELEADTDYELTYTYGNNDPLTHEKLKVAIGTSTDEEVMETLHEHLNINSGQAETGRIVFSVDTDANYHLGFNAFSDAAQNELYLDDIHLDIAPDCPAPINLTLDELTATSAKISWEIENIADAYIIEYGVESSEDIIDNLSVENQNFVNLTNLDASTTYWVTVQADCGDSTSSTSTLYFSSLCAPAALPYALDLDELEIPALPSCIQTENQSAGNEWETTEVSFLGMQGKVLQYEASPTQPARAWFFTQGIELEAGIDYQLAYAYATNSSEKTEQLKVAYGMSPGSSAMLNELADYTSIQSTEVTPKEHIFSVSESGVYYFGFQAHAAPDQGALYVASIQVQEAPSCLRPTGIDSSSITENSALITWDDVNSAGNYKIKYGAYGFDPDTEGEVILTNSTTANLENLDSGTTYQVFIKALCSETDESEYSFALAFTTTCAAQDLPYIESFENAWTPALPNCTETENLGSGNEWETYDEAQVENPILNSTVLRYQADPFEAADTWFYTNGVNLEAGQNYQVTYTYANNTTNTNFFEKLAVAIGPSTSANEMEVIADHPHISGGTPETETIIFSVESNGVYYFGFHAYSNFNASTLYLDEIEIDYGPTCPAPSNLYYTNQTHNSVNFSWEGFGSTNEWEVNYGLYGFNPDTEGIATIMVNDPEVQLSDLEPETFYDVYVRSVCSETENSEWNGPKTFKTKIEPPVNNKLCEALTLSLNEPCTLGSYTTLGAFSQENEPEACFNYPGKTVWFSFEAPESGSVTIASEFSDVILTSEIAVFEAPEDCENLESLGAVIACGGYGSSLFLSDLNPGELYYLQLAANSNQEGDFCIEISTELSTNQEVFEGFSFYPNPAKDRIHLQAKAPIEQISIYTITGQIVHQQSLNTSEGSIAIDRLQAGIYFMQVHIKGSVQTHKIVVE